MASGNTEKLGEVILLITVLSPCLCWIYYCSCRMLLALYLDRFLDHVAPAVPSAVIVTGDPSAPALSDIVTGGGLLTGVVIVDDDAGAGSVPPVVGPVDGAREGVVVLPGQVQMGLENSGEQA